MKWGGMFFYLLKYKVFSYTEVITLLFCGYQWRYC